MSGGSLTLGVCSTGVHCLVALHGGLGVCCVGTWVHGSCAVMVCTGVRVCVCVAGWGAYVVSCAAVTGHVAWCGAWVPGWLAGCVHGCVAGCVHMGVWLAASLALPKTKAIFAGKFPAFFSAFSASKSAQKKIRGIFGRISG